MTEETRKSTDQAPKLLLILNGGWVFCVILLGLLPDDWFDSFESFDFTPA